MLFNKTYLITFLIFCITFGSLAQRPQKIQGIAKEDKPISYYKEQSKLWYELIQKDPKQAEAWHYYYKSERARLQLEQPDLWANNKDAFYKKLNPILDNAQKHITNEYEYFYLRGLNTRWDSAITLLKKAYSIDPYRSESYGWLFSHYAPNFNETKSKEIAKKMLESNVYSDANLKWNYNALQSVEKNGVIITNGDMDAIPKWVLQYGQGVRTDVLVISKWFFATEPTYKEQILKRLDIQEPEKRVEDFKGIPEYVDYITAELLKRIHRPIYMSSGTPMEFFRNHNLDDKMYLVGNALKYSEKDFDNTAVIKKNFEEKYYLEYLFKNFQHHPEDNVVKTNMNLTYLPGLIHLKDYYTKQNQSDKIEYYESLIQKVAKDSGRKEEVLKWFR